jgi:aflatoxin B1 aldehyde reductase
LTFDSKNRVYLMKLSLGTMIIADQLDDAKSKALVDAWLATGERELDTAFMYPTPTMEGKTESVLGAMRLAADVAVSTKANAATKGGLTRESVLAQGRGSLARLGTKQVDIFYLHWPDHKTDILETLGAVQTLYEEGAFRRFGVSNYAAWQVAEIYFLMKERNWVLPTAAQYLYNVLSRDVERELLPVCRRLGISVYVYNATCGGFVSGDATTARFSTSVHSDRYRARYVNDSFERAVALLKEAAARHKLDPYDVAIRWLAHHSGLRRGVDGIIIGCSSVSSLEKNVASARAGPLPAELVEALDKAAQISKPSWPPYSR